MGTKKISCLIHIYSAGLVLAL